jgi:outer membrane protein assembly factor BamB
MNKAPKIKTTSGLMIIILISSFMLSIGGVPLVFSEDNHPDSQILFEGYDSHISAYEKDTLTKIGNKYNSKVNRYVFSDEDSLNEKTMSNDAASIVRSGKGCINSSWPMRSHDTFRTGRSPYSTVENPLVEKWRFPADDWICGSPVIDNNEIVYFGGGNFFAVYSNGTLKWVVNTGGLIDSTPAIDENGNIYVGSTSAVNVNYFYAFYPNGTEKWHYAVGHNMYSSPVVGDDGSVFFGDCNGFINALYTSNGSLRWRYQTGGWVMSSPAIGSDGTIYCGSHDHNLYALYSNGTKKWQFPTGDWIRASPSIADDGTIYVGSYDDYLYALYPNGTLKWKLKVGYGCDSNPSIANDGTIYIGSDKLYAVNPDGTLKWSYNLGTDRYIAFSCPAISSDGTIFVGVCIRNGAGGELLAIRPDGTERWRSGIICNEGIWSSPAIAKDGTVYVGSLHDYEIHNGGYTSRGYLHAFGPGEIKQATMVQPIPGKCYLFGTEKFSTLSGKTIILRNVTVRANVTNLDDLDHIGFFVDGNLQYDDTEAPYEWNMNTNYYWDILFEHHRIRVTAFYKGGCEWSDERFVTYIRLL